MKFSKTKGKFTCDQTGETKFFLLNCLAKQSNFCKTNDKFHLVSCFAKLKKTCKTGNPNRLSGNTGRLT
jgi:hypothetical protein